MDRDIKTRSIDGNENSEVMSITSKYGDASILMHRRQILDQRATTAASFAEKWALVACELDGEDSAGRQKLRRLTPDELATQTCQAVEFLYKAFAARGWILNVPPYEEAIKFPTTEQGEK
jgi:hypothetical protein